MWKALAGRLEWSWVVLAKLQKWPVDSTPLVTKLRGDRSVTPRPIYSRRLFQLARCIYVRAVC